MASSNCCAVARGTPLWLDPVLYVGNHPLVLDGQETRGQTLDDGKSYKEQPVSRLGITVSSRTGQASSSITIYPLQFV